MQVNWPHCGIQSRGKKMGCWIWLARRPPWSTIEITTEP